MTRTTVADRIDWVDAAGVITPLTGMPGVMVERGRLGFDMPPIAVTRESVPLQPGARFRQARHQVRELTVPILLDDPNPVMQRATLRRLAQILDPVRGAGALRVTAIDGQAREIACRYVSGFEGAMTEATWSPVMARRVLVFQADDPYWYDATPVTAQYGLSTPSVFFPIFPLVLSASTVLADATLVNDGDVEAWPVWDVAGPGDNLVLRNLTTGRAIVLNSSLTLGQSVEIDTRPGAKTVVRNDGANLFGQLSADSALWQLVRGSNLVRLELNGATVDSTVSLSFRRRWLGA